MSTTFASPAAAPISAPASVVTAAREVLADLDDVIWAAKRPHELLDAKQELERLRSQMAAVDAALACEIEATNAAPSEAWASAADYLTAVSGGHRGAGRAWLRTSRDLTGECGTTMEALRNGWVSPEHAQVICSAIRLLPVDASLRGLAERHLLEDARTLNATELREASRHLLELLDPEGCAKRDEKALARAERSAHLNRHLVIVDDGLGGVNVRGRGTVEDAATIKAALFPLTKPVPATDPDCGADGRDPRDHCTRLWDALVEACQRVLDTETLPESHGAKPRVSVTIDAADLRDAIGEGTLDTGERLSAAAVRRLACDADIIPVMLGSNSEVLDVGRLQRLVTAAIWKALVARDKHCTFPGCRRPPIACDAHHITHWLDGGGTGLDNLALLCGAHHTIIHNSPWQIRLNPIDKLPEFIPPVRLDPEQRPIRERRPRE